MDIQLLINISLVTLLPAFIAFLIERNRGSHLSRKGYIYRLLALFILSVVYGFLLGTSLNPSIQPVVNSGFSGLLNVFIFIFGFQRLRDCGIQEKYFWLFAVPFINLFFALALMFLQKRTPPNSDFNA